MSELRHDYDEDDYPVPLHLIEPTDPAERTRLLDEARASMLPVTAFRTAGFALVA